MSELNLRQVPDSWQWVEVQQIAEVVTGNTPPTSNPENYDGEIPFVKPPQLIGSSISSAPETLSNSGASKARVLPIGAVLVSCIGNLGKIAISKVPCATNQQINALLFEAHVLPEFGFYYAQTLEPWLNSVSSATTVSIVNKGKFETAPFPLAPAAEQTRIVEKLEELLSDLDAGVAELKAAQKKLIQYRQSLLNAALEGLLTGVPGGYPKFSLGSLVISIGQGWSPRCEGEAVGSDDVWAVMKTTAIQPMRFDGKYNKKLPVDLNPRLHLELMPGDLLVTRAGPRTRVGVTCLIREVKKRLILCDKAYRIRCNESLINPEFLELVLNAPSFVNAIDAIKTGISDSGLNLTQDRFFLLMIPLPALEEQAKIITTIEAVVNSIEQQALAITYGLKQSAAQRKNILQAAFSGQLVPQDPADEPASALLARIRAERAARETGSARGRGKKKVST